MVKLIDNEFTKLCIDDNCTCDCRINLKGCPNETFNFIALTVLIPFTFIIVIISLSFLYYRVKVKGQSVFFPATRERGLIRPRPQDSFHIAVGVFNFSQMIVLILLITDSFPNVTFAEIVIHIPKLLGFSCAVLYPISIIYSTPILKQTTYSLRIQWNPNKYFIDGLAIYLMIGPLLTIIPLTALTGHLADLKENHNAEYIFMIQALTWSCWTIQYFVTLLYVYYKLFFMLKDYIDILQRRRDENFDAEMKIKNLKNASHNLSWIVAAVFLMFFINGLEGILVGFKYNENPLEANKNICQFYYFISWNFTIPVLTFIGQLIFLYDTLKNRKSTQNQHSNTYDRVNNIPSRLEQNSRLIQKSRELSDDFYSSQSIQKSKSNKSLFTINSNSTKKYSVNNSSVDVKKSLFSTMATSITSLIHWDDSAEKSRNNTKDLDNWKFFDSDVNYYFENSDNNGDKGKDKIIKSGHNTIVIPGIRKSWLIKKPVRSATSTMKNTVNRNLFLQDNY
ncbi:unnamed protein product [Rhizophagus irregularis]|nr:unnamed protein product [Rhizophagus irregularis]